MYVRSRRSSRPITSKVYNISLELQDRIRQACYGTKAKRVIAASDERPANHAAQSERDARAGN
jgi:hypothetical protein